MSDADVANASFRLPGAQSWKMRPPIEKVVDLHQVDWRRPQQRRRSLHLFDTALASTGPHFRGDERMRNVRDQIAGNLFGVTVHRRAVDDASACIGESTQHFDERRALTLALADVERLPCAETDDRDLFAAVRNRALDHRLLREVTSDEG